MTAKKAPAKRKPAKKEAKAKSPRKPGRPSKYSPEVADAICERLSKGEPLARICDDPAMPGYSTVRRWEDEDESFRALSARAREIGCDFIADDCIRIADDSAIEPADKRIRVDTRIRLLGKWYAKRYGERQILAGDPEAPLMQVPDDQLDARLKKLLAKAKP